jgi:hypothetical protein
MSSFAKALTLEEFANAALLAEDRRSSARVNLNTPPPLPLSGRRGKFNSAREASRGGCDRDEKTSPA